MLFTNKSLKYVIIKKTYVYNDVSIKEIKASMTFMGYLRYKHPYFFYTIVKINSMHFN